ncbi:MAG: hypothetical protein KDK59_05675 [Simkania sp.]|nr:hypothetical protein [Simkania sp.]
MSQITHIPPSLAGSQTRFTGASHDPDQKYRFEAIFRLLQEDPLFNTHQFTITQETEDPLNNRLIYTIQFENGESTQISIQTEDLLQELNLPYQGHFQFPGPEMNYKEAFRLGNFKDGFTLAATAYFKLTTKTIAEISPQWNYFDPQSRIAVDGDHLVLTKRGLSRFEQLFHSIFNTTTYQEYMDQNTTTINAYQKFLKQEVGSHKVALIEKTFGISLEKMKSEGHPLLPIHIYYFNIGMNDIEMSDATALKTKLSDLPQNSNQKALDYFATPGSVFTMREIRGMLSLFIDTPPEDVTLANIVNKHKKMGLNFCIEAVMTPEVSRDRAFTGKKFSAPIIGAYNEEIKDRKTRRPWVDMQELAQVQPEILNLAPNRDKKTQERCFQEYLCKIAVKKHLMRSSADGSDWRVDSILPSPFKHNGQTVWYHAVQGVDSAHGKLWYVFKPANPDHEKMFPVYRVLRDTCPCPYAQRGGPTISRDVAENAGYKYSNATEQEDREFFDQYTLPVWMGHLFVAHENEDLNKKVASIHKAGEELLSEMTRQHMYRPLKQDESNRLKEKTLEIYGILAKLTPETADDQLKELLKMASDNDQNLFQKLQAKETFPPIVSVGTSLGGFDAQYDVVKHTALRHRIPITNLSVYSHSTLKIRAEDDQVFSEFIIENIKLLKALGVKLELDHITEKGDLVSVFGENRTFLGESLQKRLESESYNAYSNMFPTSLRTFTPNTTSTNDQIQKVDTHIRRVEHLSSQDVNWETQDDTRETTAFEEFRQYCKESQEKYPLDMLHAVANTLGIFNITDTTWRLHRYFYSGDDRILRENRNDKLVVTPNGGQFKSIPTRHLEVEHRLFYNPMPEVLREHFNLGDQQSE